MKNKKLKLSIIFILLFISILVFSRNERYPYCSIIKNVKVCSDISLKFSKEHANHALLVWNYFKKIFKKSPGNKIELYYTLNKNKYKEELKKYPTIVIEGARQLTCFWDRDHRKWYIIPYKIPDFGTQLHEMSHDFLYCTYNKSLDYPWFKEGSGMYYESGSFDANGNLIIIYPFKSFHELFLKYNISNELIPLRKLLYLQSDAFYRTDFTKTYSQSLMLFYYLMKKYSIVMDNLFKLINDGEIASNDRVISYLLRNIKKSIDEIDKDYRAYSENL